MSNVSCPRCGDLFRLPAAEIPPGASARCPWCGEMLPVTQLLSSLPPVAEVFSTSGEPLGNPFASAAQSANAWDDADEAASPAAAALDDEAPAQEDREQPFAPLEYFTDDAADEELGSEDHASHDSPLEFGEPVEPRPLSEVAEVSFDRDQQRLSTRPRAKKKTSSVRSIVGIVIGGLMAFPLAAVILALLGKPLDLGFWPFDGQTISTGNLTRTAAPLPPTDHSQPSPRRSPTAQDRSLAYDLEASGKNGVIQADHNRVEPQTTAEHSFDADNRPEDPLTVTPAPADWAPVPLQVPGGRVSGPEWVKPLTADETEPAEEALPVELQPTPEPTQPEIAALPRELSDRPIAELEMPELELPAIGEALTLPQPNDPPSIDTAIVASDIADAETSVAELEPEAMTAADEPAVTELEAPAVPEMETPLAAASQETLPLTETQEDLAAMPPAASAGDETAEPETAEPALPPTPAISPEMQSALASADESLTAVQNYDLTEGTAGLKRHLATLYADVAAVGEAAQQQDAATIGDLIARLKAGDLIKDLAPAAPNWLKYSKRPNNGMLAVGTLRQADAAWFIDWSATVPLEVHPGDLQLPAAGSQVLVLGRMLSADPAAPVLELVHIEPLK